jgi:hypothetical protein
MAGEDVLASIALMVATKATEGLSEAGRAAFAALARLVKRRFQGSGSAQAALTEAEADPADSTRLESLREELAQAAADDPAFDHQLRRLWQDLALHLEASAGGVVNNLSGPVGGNVVQARDIQGGISFGGASTRDPEPKP